MNHQLARPDGAEVPTEVKRIGIKPLPYTSHPEAKLPKVRDIIFKRIHRDGHIDDRYTALDNGTPLGSDIGDIPEHLKGLKKLPEDYDSVIQDGWPNLNYEYRPNQFAKDYRNFADTRPVNLPSGTKIYRIVDEFENNSGAYWAYELPNSKAEWRANYAVKDSWNDNGYYVEHIVGEDGLKVWEGTVAGQRYDESDYYLRGGKLQLFVTPGSIPTTPPALTKWNN